MNSRVAPCFCSTFQTILAEPVRDAARKADRLYRPGLGVEHVPLVPEHPSERRKLAVDHAPLEVVPRPEVLLAVFALDSSGRLQRAFPYVPLNGLAGAAGLG